MSDTPPEESTPGRTLVVSLGKKSRKQVKKLKKGQGKLTRRVHDLVADLAAEGEISSDAHIVIVTVERKEDKRWRGWRRWRR